MTDTEGKLASYREKQILTASPLELIIITYDVALRGCRQGDSARSLEALSVLRSGLSWEQSPDLAPR